MKKTILYIILLLNLTCFFSACAYIQKDDTLKANPVMEMTDEETTEETVEEARKRKLPEKLSKEKFEIWYLRLVEKKEPEGWFKALVTGMTDSEIEKIMQSPKKCRDPYFLYYVDVLEVRTEYEEYGEERCVSVHVIPSYKENRIPREEIRTVRSVEDAYLLYEETFITGFEEVVMDVQNPELEAEDLAGLVEEMAWNNGEKIPLFYKEVVHEAFSRKDGTYLLSMTLDFASYGFTREDQIQAQMEVSEQVTEITEQVKAFSDDPREQCKELYRIINRRVDFSYKVSNALDDVLTSTDPFIGSERGIYGALIHDASVCSGYAAAFKAVCDRLGIPCIVLLGYADNSDHAWNMVLLDGEAVQIDTTWGDSAKWYNTYLFIRDDVCIKENRRIYDYMYIPQEFLDGGYVEKREPINLYG